MSGKVEEIKIDKVSKNKQNIITIKGKRSLRKTDDNEDKIYLSEHNSSRFSENLTLFNLTIISEAKLTGLSDFITLA